MLAIKTDRRTNYWSFHSSCWDLSKADTNSISVHPSYWNLPFSLNKADGQTTLHFIPHFRIHLRQMDRLHITSTFIIGSTSAGWKNYASFHPQIGIYARQTDEQTTFHFTPHFGIQARYTDKLKMDLHEPLQTRGETRCPGGVSVSCLVSHTRHECPRHNESVFMKAWHWMWTDTI